jgi:DNA modification methylase
MQISGRAEIIDMWSEEYLNMLAFKKIQAEALKKSSNQLYLIKIKPSRIDYINAEFKKLGFDVRQHIIFDD